MIQLNTISLSFGSQKIFEDISALFNDYDRIGMVGPNGAGKSTLLKAIAGMQHLDSGVIVIGKQTQVAYMPQEVVLESTQTIEQEAFNAFTAIAPLYHEAQLLQKLVDANEATIAQAERLAILVDELSTLNPEAALVETRKILLGLGFKQEQLAQPVSTLSIGWRMRIVLAKLLLQKADFYLFDEPTNHLDIFATEWFLEFLKQAPFGFLIISHERSVLNQVCNTIFELAQGKATFFEGNYDSYRQEKERRQAALEQAYLTQQKELKRKQDVIDKFRAGTRSTMAKSMERQLERIERIELPPQGKKISLTLGAVQQAGKIVLTVKNVAQAFGQTIFKNVSFEIARGQKVALIAANGVGKSTLFNLIAGKLPLQQGSIEQGYNVSMALFEQHQELVLNKNKTIIDEVLDATPHKTQAVIRSLLGAFLFDNDAIQKKIKVLSGGEKQRVSMVKVLLQDANFLVLDEPTNHLDIQSKEILLDALKAYQGTVLFVSHDRDFINQLATRILELTPHGIESYEGSFDDYWYWKKLKERNELSACADIKKTKDKGSPVVKNNTQSVSSLEKLVGQLEHKVQKLGQELGNHEYGSAEYTVALKQFEALRKQLDDALEQWEKLI